MNTSFSRHSVAAAQDRSQCPIHMPSLVSLEDDDSISSLKSSENLVWTQRLKTSPSTIGGRQGQQAPPEYEVVAESCDWCLIENPWSGDEEDINDSILESSSSILATSTFNDSPPTILRKTPSFWDKPEFQPRLSGTIHRQDQVSRIHEFRDKHL